MSRETAKAKYSRQEGEPEVGYITPADAQQAIDIMYDDLVEDRIPTSSTDDTVARFDGTGGALQGSGVTIGDDSSIGIDPTTAGYLYIGTAGSGHAAAIQAHTGAAGATSTRRWWFGKQQAAETGSNAGSDFGIYAYDDSGNGLGYGLEINRATRKVTVSAPGSSAGLEFGASGPRMMAGTGSPEGSVTAPPGSEWRQTDDADLAYLRWFKATGTGSTGWLPDFEGRWVTYEATWTGTGGTPSIGNGNTAGSYTLTGKTCHFKAQLQWGSTTNANGATDWRLGLPLPRSGTFIFPVLIFDSGARYYSNFHGQTLSGDAIRFYGDASPYQINATYPMTWASGDTAYVSGTYQIA